jgi:hypothetical protein
MYIKQNFKVSKNCSNEIYELFIPKINKLGIIYCKSRVNGLAFFIRKKRGLSVEEDKGYVESKFSRHLRCLLYSSILRYFVQKNYNYSLML